MSEPASEYLAGLVRLEVVDQVAYLQHPARPQHPRDTPERDRLPEVRQLMQRMTGIHAIRRRPLMFIAQESGPDAAQVSQPGRGGPLGQHPHHGG
jgi:hypothetical protein